MDERDVHRTTCWLDRNEPAQRIPRQAPEGIVWRAFGVGDCTVIDLFHDGQRVLTITPLDAIRANAELSAVLLAVIVSQRGAA